MGRKVWYFALQIYIRLGKLSKFARERGRGVVVVVGAHNSFSQIYLEFTFFKERKKKHVWREREKKEKEKKKDVNQGTLFYALLRSNKLSLFTCCNKTEQG